MILAAAGLAEQRDLANPPAGYGANESWHVTRSRAPEAMTAEQTPHVDPQTESTELPSQTDRGSDGDDLMQGH